MSRRPAHKWKTVNGRTRMAIGLVTAGAIAVVAVGVSSASTVRPGQTPAGTPASGPATTAHHPFGLGALPDKDATRASALRSAAEPRVESLAPQAVGSKSKDKKAKKKSQAVPASFSLAKYAATPGNQGQVGSCVAWAVDYSAYSVLEHEQGIAGGPQAPMYTYSQIVQGRNVGTTPEDNLRIAMSQGVDAQSDYRQGNYDYTDLPTSAERANAASWKLSGYTPLHTGSRIKADVEAAVAAGEPVAISIPVYNDFFSLTPQQAASYAYYPNTGSGYAGGHEITVVGYTSKGVRVENSWGTGWGDHGYINLSWSYLANQVDEANAIGKLVQD
ncbi:C1 family peptidase [Streptantibioticus parmotrematis]|nr:C1 family peptidase [Streptantibioticus parmotrematis]